MTILNNSPAWRQARKVLGLLCCLVTFQGFANNPATFSLNHTLQLALEHDPWLANSRFQEQALLAQGEAADALPDPTLSTAVANLPTDSFDFAQENMTQLKFGITQQLPRGDSLRLQKNRLQLQAAEQPLQRQIRRARVTQQISDIWYQLSGENSLLQQLQTDRTLFEQLLAIAQNRYASALQATKQNAILLAELELARLDNQISRREQQRDAALAKLLQWLPPREVVYTTTQHMPSLPKLETLPPALIAAQQSPDLSQLSQLLQHHPALLHAQQQHKVSKVGINLAKQRDEPRWSVSASYAYRDNNNNADIAANNDRADFVSLGLSMAVPLWNSEKNQHHLKAAKWRSEAVKTQHRLLQQQMLADLQQFVQEHRHLQQQTQRYTRTILPTLQQYTDATLTAFTNDEGELEDVIRARIESRNAKLALIELHIAQHQLQANIAYLLTGSGIALSSKAPHQSNQIESQPDSQNTSIGAPK